MAAREPKLISVSDYELELQNMTDSQILDFTRFVRVTVDALTYTRIRAEDPSRPVSDMLVDLADWCYMERQEREEFLEHAAQTPTHFIEVPEPRDEQQTQP